MRAEVAKRSGAGGLLVEAPARRCVDSPGLEVTGAEVEELAEVAGLDDLARQAHGRHEAVVEAAHVHDRCLLCRAPDRVRLFSRPPERLLAEDMLAVSRRLDRRLGMEVVRAAVVEELNALVGHLLAPVRRRLLPPVEPAGLLHLLGRAPGDRDEARLECGLEVGRLAECAGVRLAHEGVAEHRDADRVRPRAHAVPSKYFSESAHASRPH